MLFRRADFEAGYQDFKTRLENYEKVISEACLCLLCIIVFLSWMFYFFLTQILYISVKVYEPVEEGSYIKVIDMVKGHGGQIQVIQQNYTLHI